MFNVSAPLRRLPNIDLWTVQPPKALTRVPLAIRFDRPFDNHMAESSLVVLDREGQRIAGKITLSEDQTLWQFEPDIAWQGGSIQLFVDARLEDVAGNNFRDLLDHSVETELRKLDEITLNIDLLD